MSSGQWLILWKEPGDQFVYIISKILSRRSWSIFASTNSIERLQWQAWRINLIRSTSQEKTLDRISFLFDRPFTLESLMICLNKIIHSENEPWGEIKNTTNDDVLLNSQRDDQWWDFGMAMKNKIKIEHESFRWERIYFNAVHVFEYLTTHSEFSETIHTQIHDS